LCSASASPTLPLTIDLGVVDLATDQGQSCGPQVALASELEELFHQEPVLVSVSVPSSGSSSHSPAGRSPKPNEVRQGSGEPADEEEAELPLGQSSLLTLAAFFSEFESPSRLKAFAVDFVDLGGEKVWKQVL